MSDRFREAITKAWNRLEERQWILGRMGRVNPSGSVTFDVPGRKGFVYVRVRNSLGAQSTVPARNDGAVPHTANLPVKMKLENGVYVIHSRTSRADLNEEPATPPSGVFSHPLGEHSNVDFSTPVDGYVVTWSESLGMYILTEPTGGDIAGEIEGATEQTVPEDTNKIALTDDDGLGGRILKWMSWANIKTALTTLFDGLYVGLTGDQTVDGVKTFSDGIRTQIIDVQDHQQELSWTAGPIFGVGNPPSIAMIGNDASTSIDGSVRVRTSTDNSALGDTIFETLVGGVSRENLRIEGATGFVQPSVGIIGEDVPILSHYSGSNALVYYQNYGFFTMTPSQSCAIELNGTHAALIILNVTGRICVIASNRQNSTIAEIADPSGTFVNSSTPASNQFGYWKTAPSDVINLVNGWTSDRVVSVTVLGGNVVGFTPPA